MKELNERLNKLAENLKWHNVGYAQDVLAAVEALRGLEQRAEAAEAECDRLDTESRNLSTQLGGCDRERRSALRELAELNKQKPVGTVSISMDWNTHRNIATVNMRPDLVVAEMKDGDELFTRPAPAVSLAELVQVSERLKQRYICNEGSDVEFIACFTPDRSSLGTGDVWDDWREISAILRNIEEQSQ